MAKHDKFNPEAEGHEAVGEAVRSSGRAEAPMDLRVEAADIPAGPRESVKASADGSPWPGVPEPVYVPRTASVDQAPPSWSSNIWEALKATPRTVVDIIEFFVENLINPVAWTGAIVGGVLFGPWGAFIGFAIMAAVTEAAGGH